MSTNRRNSNRTSRQHTTNRDNILGDGMIISSMSIPQPKSPTTARKTQAVSPEVKPRPQYEANNLAGDLEKQVKGKDKALKEMERRLKETTGILKANDDDIKSLQTEKQALSKQVTDLSKELKMQEKKQEECHKELNMLKDQISELKNNEIDYKKLYQDEIAAHSHTSEKLSMCESDCKTKSQQLIELEENYKAQLKTIQDEMQEKIDAIKREKDDAINDRERRIQKLKKQIADTFAGSSMERQQQIDDLAKELTKAQNECDSLRQKLGKVANGHHASLNSVGTTAEFCTNCKNLKAHLEKKDQSLKERDRKIAELSQLCSRFEAQLSQQQELVRQWQQGVQDRVYIFDKLNSGKKK